MKVLMLTPYLPYPDSSGGQIRTQNLLKHLRKHHDITLFSLIKNPAEKRFTKALEKDFCKKVKVYRRSPKPFTLPIILKTGFSTMPHLVVRNFSKEAKQAIETELKTHKYDLIHVETFYAMPHLPKTDIPVVLVDQTIEFKVYEHYVENTAPSLLKPLFRIDTMKLKHWERFYWRQADKVIAVSDKDMEEMKELEPGLDVELVPNGVNLDLFKKRTNFNSKQPKILFIGNFTWLQNTEAANILIKRILPVVKKSIKEAVVWIVGQHQPDSLKALASDSVIVKDVAESDYKSIQDAYHDADIFCTPLFGPGGTRLKNLAAMASQLPIVSSTVGITGLGVEHKKHVMISDNPNIMAKYIIRLIKNPQFAKSLATTSREYVEKEFDYKMIAEKLSNIYKTLAYAKS